jgi:hypothetical protein
MRNSESGGERRGEDQRTRASEERATVYHWVEGREQYAKDQEQGDPS